MRGEEKCLECEVLGPLGKMAPLGDFGFWGILAPNSLGLASGVPLLRMLRSVNWGKHTPGSLG